MARRGSSSRPKNDALWTRSASSTWQVGDAVEARKASRALRSSRPRRTTINASCGSSEARRDTTWVRQVPYSDAGSSRRRSSGSWRASVSRQSSFASTPTDSGKRARSRKARTGRCGRTRRGGGGGEEPARREAVGVGEERPCKLDADCVIVPDGCCGCANGGKQRGAAKKDEAALRAAQRTACKDVMCTMMVSTDPSCGKRATCLAGSARCAMRARTSARASSGLRRGSRAAAPSRRSLASPGARKALPRRRDAQFDAPHGKLIALGAYTPPHRTRGLMTSVQLLLVTIAGLGVSGCAVEEVREVDRGGQRPAEESFLGDGKADAFGVHEPSYREAGSSRSRNTLSESGFRAGAFALRQDPGPRASYRRERRWRAASPRSPRSTRCPPPARSSFSDSPPTPAAAASLARAATERPRLRWRAATTATPTTATLARRAASRRSRPPRCVATAAVETGESCEPSLTQTSTGSVPTKADWSLTRSGRAACARCSCTSPSYDGGPSSTTDSGRQGQRPRLRGRPRPLPQGPDEQLEPDRLLRLRRPPVLPHRGAGSLQADHLLDWPRRSSRTTAVTPRAPTATSPMRRRSTRRWSCSLSMRQTRRRAWRACDKLNGNPDAYNAVCRYQHRRPRGGHLLPGDRGPIWTADDPLVHRLLLYRSAADFSLPSGRRWRGEQVA